MWFWKMIEIEKLNCTVTTGFLFVGYLKELDFSLVLPDNRTKGIKNVIIVHRPIKMIKDEKLSSAQKEMRWKMKQN